MSFDDVLMLRSYLTDIKNLERFVQIELEYFKSDFPPAHTSVEVPKTCVARPARGSRCYSCNLKLKKTDVAVKGILHQAALIVVLHMPPP